MKKQSYILAILFFFTLVTSLALPKETKAIPAFARQTGMACSTCHFQHFPALNAFGRYFKAGGYTMVGGQSMIEGDMLSLPSTLNASIVLKVRYQKTNGDGEIKTTTTYALDPDDGSIDPTTSTVDTGKTGTNKGELQFPDEAALFLGGRIGEHMGFAYEMGLNGEGFDNFTSFKMPFVYDVMGAKVSLIPFNTDGLGAAFGFELLNTGAVRNVRTIEHRNDISAQQYIGTDGAAEGIAFVAANNMGFINYSLWVPSHTATDIGPSSHYLRIAATPTVSGWDLGGGVQWWGGTTSIGTCVVDPPGCYDEDHPDNDYKTHALAIDAQAQGAVMSKPLGVYISYGNAEKSKAGETENFFNSNADDKTALSVSAELGVLPNKATVALGYRTADTGAASDNKDNAFVLGATYQFAQNVQLQLNHSSYGGSKYDTTPADGDQLTTLMLFTAF
ncbi:MAG TPA: hypothetical protein VJ187_00130 [Nitrospirota bacterium]|nr:hypothetical protein [Nitrospirota bacterium]